MRYARYATMIVLMMLFTGQIAIAQGRGPGRGPVPDAAPAPAHDPADGVLPSLSFSRVPIEKVIAALQEQVLGFQVQILRSADVPEGFPEVTFDGKNIAVGQFMDYLKTAYGLKWENIPGPREWITIVRIELTPEIATQVERKEREEGLKNPLPETPARPQFRVYSLVELTAGKRMGLADVLSLVEAAIKQSGEEKLNLQVHETTNTLLATGGVRSLRVLESVLATLKPNPDDQRREYEAKIQEAQQAQRLAQIEFEGRLRAMEVERARMEQAMQGERSKLEQAMQAQEADWRSRVRQLEQELTAARASIPQPR